MQSDEGSIFFLRIVVTPVAAAGRQLDPGSFDAGICRWRRTECGYSAGTLGYTDGVCNGASRTLYVASDHKIPATAVNKYSSYSFMRLANLLCLSVEG